ncbi:VOC family protein [Roseateles chitosanitabidus]|uniref:VOC family protein n=1 Tax=Roseateles chitosanitabidus TaxID=65048 RepID=UPI00082EDDD2|nr:VOC family protein [Roseateles chitosanitabidus]
MSTFVTPVPAPSGVLPYLTVRGAEAAIAFYQRAFGAKLLLRLDAPDGLMHAELTVGGARFMMTEEREHFGGTSPLKLNGSPVNLTIYVPDADATVKAAEAAGARIEMPVQDHFWGDRMGLVTDPFGHKWMVATHIEDVGEAQLHERLAKMFAEGQQH